MTLIDVEPMFDPLRWHPRFEALRAEVGFTKAAAEPDPERRSRPALIVEDERPELFG